MTDEVSLTELATQVDRLVAENRALRKSLGVRTVFLLCWALLVTGVAAAGLATLVEERTASQRSADGGGELTLASTDGQRLVRLRASGSTGLAVGEAVGGQSVERLRLAIDEDGQGHLVLEGRARAGVTLRAPADGPGEVETARLVLSDRFGRDRAVLRLDERGRVLLERLDDAGQVVSTTPLGD